MPHPMHAEHSGYLNCVRLQQSKEAAVAAASGAAQAGDHESAYRAPKDDFNVKARVVPWQSATTVVDWLKQHVEADV